MTEIQKVPTSEAIERVVVQGDLSQLTPAERVGYYKSVCQSLGLNPLTGPLAFITLNGRLVLYAKKDAADQLREIHGVSIGKPDIQFQDDLILVTVAAHDAKGREDSDVGIVKTTDMRGDKANAIMKAVTKAKRRVTLSICGLGFLDETEVETIPEAKPVPVEETLGELLGQVTPENIHPEVPVSPADPVYVAPITSTQYYTEAKALGLDRDTAHAIVKDKKGDFDAAMTVLLAQYGGKP